jgi:hypothetical protein
MKLKRYQVTISVGISAKNEKDAARIMTEIIESGRAAGSSSPTAIAQIILSDKPIVKKLPF